MKAADCRTELEEIKASAAPKSHLSQKGMSVDTLPAQKYRQDRALKPKPVAGSRNQRQAFIELEAMFESKCAEVESLQQVIAELREAFAGLVKKVALLEEQLSQNDATANMSQETTTASVITSVEGNLSAHRNVSNARATDQSAKDVLDSELQKSTPVMNGKSTSARNSRNPPRNAVDDLIRILSEKGVPARDIPKVISEQYRPEAFPPLNMDFVHERLRYMGLLEDHAAAVSS